MVAPKLKITDSINGLPNLKVPLRYAVLVSGLSVKTFTASLEALLDVDPPQKGTAVKVSELSTSGIRNCSPKQFADILKQMKAPTTAKAQMALLPVNWYIQSSDLATLFTRYIDFNLGRDNATTEKLELNWSPPIAGYESLIKSSFSSLANSNLKSKQELRRESTDRKHKAWFKEYERYITKKPSANTSDAARAVAKKFSVKASTVRRVITNLKNS